VSARYFTGKPCKYGHIAERRADNGTCVACLPRIERASGARYRRRLGLSERTLSRKAALAAGALTYQSNRPCRRKHKQLRYTKDGSCVQCAQEKTKRRAAEIRRWHAQNRGKVNANVAKCTQKRKQRIPAWADLEAIRFFYECCPADCHVDHVIPLNGKHVSGLHVETNLQWLPSQANLQKGNRYAYA
jgi:hypothetical protein